MADTSRMQLYFTAESTWGVTPGSPAMSEFRNTGESLRHNKGTIVSNEIRADAQITDTPEVSAGAGGDVNFELSYGAYDPFFAALLRTTWPSQVLVSASLSFNAGAHTIGTNGSFAGLAAGQFVRVRNTVSNNGFYLVASITGGNTIVVDDTFKDVVNEGPVSCLVDGTMIRNGTLEQSFTLEKLFSDIPAGVGSGRFTNFPGMRVGGLQLAVTADQAITGTWSFLGKEGFNVDTTVGGSIVAAPAWDVINATSNVGGVFEDGAALTAALQGVQFNMSNNLRAKRAIGSRGALGIGYGRINLSGQINAYFDNGALYRKMIQHEDSSLILPFHDNPSNRTAGNTYFFRVPRMKFPEGDPTAPAAEQFVFLPLSYQGLRDPTLGKTMQIDRFPAT